MSLTIALHSVLALAILVQGLILWLNSLRFLCDEQLLAGLVSAYRYEGPKYSEEEAKSEAKILKNVIKDGAKKLHEEEEIVRILTTRSKLHLKAVFKHYKETSGNYLDEVRNLLV